ncbi:hypothetical protein FNW02_34110 [Komarekiella sp. 'clone 1']|uniref:Uncharacterized protein n=1 Tax=Komarekiella delphini-convector SJRDD-AB1 TaxID=2593771 RepID=A0AA40VUX4_9NOST|nr:hypothetical protein [Komarekiella delphini-convector]MBD6620669.1 hypothetical protein [Komarekiella delphini-convector SJRDD-AB1]
MLYYVCDLYKNNNWNLLAEEVAARKFNTEQEAKQWFRNKCSDNIEFSGFHQTERYVTNWVFYQGEEIGEITQRPSFKENH